MVQYLSTLVWGNHYCVGQKKGSVLWYTISYSFCHLGYGAAALNRMDKQVWFSVNLRFDLGQLHKNENVKEREKKVINWKLMELIVVQPCRKMRL